MLRTFNRAAQRSQCYNEGITLMYVFTAEKFKHHFLQPQENSETCVDYICSNEIYFIIISKN